MFIIPIKTDNIALFESRIDCDFQHGVLFLIFRQQCIQRTGTSAKNFSKRKFRIDWVWPARVSAWISRPDDLQVHIHINVFTALRHRTAAQFITDVGFYVARARSAILIPQLPGQDHEFKRKLRERYLFHASPSPTAPHLTCTQSVDFQLSKLGTSTTTPAQAILLINQAICRQRHCRVLKP
ncbi:hypothetical protein PPS11_05648 [Pseudomonas putida S11]|nr:hypothetical protein PPS11_05648 [Pseudomonas putida S11]